MSVKKLTDIGELAALKKMFTLLNISHNSVFKWKTFIQILSSYIKMFKLLLAYILLTFLVISYQRLGDSLSNSCKENKDIFLINLTPTNKHEEKLVT